MEKITLRAGDYVLTEGLTGEMYHDIAKAFVGAGCGKGEYPDFQELVHLPRFGWGDKGLLHGLGRNQLIGRCLTPEQILNTTSKWSGEGSYPSVGEVCEVRGTPTGSICPAVIDYIDGKHCIWHWEGEVNTIHARVSEMEFRPIKTDEERAVEGIMNILQGNIFDRGWSLGDTAKEIYNYLQKKA